MGFGIWMAASENFQFAAAHAHWNLLGFVASTLYGLIHWTHPAVSRSKLAWPQFWLHAAGVLVFVAGIFVFLTTKQGALAIAGALMVILAALTFLWLFLTTKTETP